MLAFIDDIKLIRIEFDGYIHDVSILNMSCRFVRKEGHLQYFETNQPIPLQKADVININGQQFPLHIGLVTLSDAFEKTFRYDGPLGAIYHDDHTEFYVFSPVAKEIKVCIKGHLYDMTGDGTIYKASIQGNFAFEPYHYEVRLVDTFSKVLDPYLKGTNTKDGVIIPQSLKAKKANISQSKEDAIIYEAHVRDVTQTLDVPHKGLFLGMLEKDQTQGFSFIEYAASLGMTHIQLLPIFDFEGVDPIYKSRFYNWGYNPKHYFAIQPWFSSQPTMAKVTIQEAIQMIDAIHEQGLGVIMDVVYNHVFDMDTYPYDGLVPGYFYRHDDHHQRTNGSYCGNEIETRRYMVRKLILDSLIHFVETYDIDGFRFDLMGLIDVETMNQIESELSKIKPGIMIYGEGWHMGEVLEDEEKASQVNHQKMPKIAHFNDTFRNKVKGELHGPALGYGNGGAVDLEDLILLLKGSPNVFESPAYSINYVECHDNMTLFDKILKDTHDHEHARTYQDFTNALITLSAGITFFHAGQEMYRSKKGVENSYQSSDDINQLQYDLGPHIDVFKQFIQFKKDTKDAKKQYTIKEDHIWIDVKTHQSEFEVIIKTSFKPYTIDLNSCILWISTAPVKPIKNQIVLEQYGVTILKKK